MNTYTAVDWYSFTVDLEYFDHVRHLPPHALVCHALDRAQHMKASRAVRWLFERAVPAPGRVPYAASLRDPETGGRLFYDLDRSVWLIELGGRACNELADAKLLKGLLAETWRRCTRIDVATDYEGAPGAFDALTACCYNGTSLTHASFSSQTGETRYIGSMKSDRFCRIYMYNEPHPRANIPRVELVYRADYAPQVAEYAWRGMLGEVVAGAYKRLGIPPEYAPPAVAPIEPKGRRRHAKEAAGTVRWVFTAVVPALSRLILEGHITLAEILDALDCQPAHDVVNSEQGPPD